MLRSNELGGPGKLKAGQVTVVTKDKTTIPISLDASIIYENGQEVATIGFFHDLRETISMEQQLEETRLQLFQSSKDGRFRQIGRWSSPPDQESFGRDQKSDQVSSCELDMGNEVTLLVKARPIQDDK